MLGLDFDCKNYFKKFKKAELQKEARRLGLQFDARNISTVQLCLLIQKEENKAARALALQAGINRKLDELGAPRRASRYDNCQTIFEDIKWSFKDLPPLARYDKRVTIREPRWYFDPDMRSGERRARISAEKKSLVVVNEEVYLRDTLPVLHALQIISPHDITLLLPTADEEDEKRYKVKVKANPDFDGVSRLDVMRAIRNFYNQKATKTKTYGDLVAPIWGTYVTSVHSCPPRKDVFVVELDEVTPQELEDQLTPPTFAVPEERFDMEKAYELL